MYRNSLICEQTIRLISMLVSIFTLFLLCQCVCVMSVCVCVLMHMQGVYIFERAGAHIHIHSYVGWLAIKFLAATCLHSPTFRFQAPATMSSFIWMLGTQTQVLMFAQLTLLSRKSFSQYCIFVLEKKLPISKLVNQLCILYFIKHAILAFSLVSKLSFTHLKI